MPAKKAAAKKEPESEAIKVDDSQKGKKAPKSSPVGKMAVDFGLTNMHKAKIGMMQTTRYQAASLAFTNDFAINGAIKKNGEDIGFCGYRKDSWENTELPKKRLVMKFFEQDPKKEDKIEHVGSIEWMMVPSVRASMSSAVTLLEFRVIVKGLKYVAVIKREHTKFAKHGENFAMEYPVSDDEFQIIEFDEDRFTIGSDWEVKDQWGKVIAYIDEKTMNIGGKFDITFYDEKWFKDEDFVTIVVLYTMALKYHKEIKEDLEKIIDGVKKGTMKLTPVHDEKAFLMNPRGWGRKT